MLVPPREPWPLMLGAAWLAGILPYLALMTAVLIAYPVSKAGPAAFAPAGDESEVAAVIAKFKQRDPGMAKVIAGACGGELQVRPPETRCPSLGGGTQGSHVGRSSLPRAKIFLPPDQAGPLGAVA